MRVKVREATVPQINWLVATCEGYKDLTYWPATGSITSTQPNKLQVLHNYTDSMLGVKIIERKRIALFPWRGEGDWQAQIPDVANGFGTTPLIAALRCYLLSEVGETVDVPEELK